MGRQCTVCNHRDIEEINRLLLCSDSYRDIARQFNLSKDALARHKESHIPNYYQNQTILKRSLMLTCSSIESRKRPDSSER
jgi:hypothetical protein